MFGMREEFKYLHCENCLCLQLLNPPEDMSLFYPDNYYSFSDDPGIKFRGFKGWWRRLSVRAAINRSFALWLIRLLSPLKSYKVLKRLNLTNETSILDVGCGNGSKFLYPLTEIGYTSLKGCDPFIEQSILYPNDLLIEKTELSEIKGKWDIITFHHSFEHIAIPAETLKMVAERLEDGGICIIRIPTTSSWAWEHYRENWVQIDAPRHYFLHSRESMDLLAAKAGLEVFETQYDSWHLQFTGSELYIRDIPLRSRDKRKFTGGIGGKLRKWKFKSKAKTLNRRDRGDQAAFFLRKLPQEKM